MTLFHYFIEKKLTLTQLLIYLLIGFANILNNKFLILNGV